MSEANETGDKDCGSRNCSSADPLDPHLALAALFVYRIFSECGHTWGGKQPSASKIAEFIAEQIDLMRRGNLSNRNLGGIMFHRDPLTDIVEFGVSITHHFSDSSNMVG